MMKKRNITQLWVDVDFGKKIKREALENDMPIIEYTKVLAKDTQENDKRKKNIWSI